MVQWGGPGVFVAKNSDTTSWHELFSLIASVQPKLLHVLYNNKMILNAPEHYKTHQNMSLGSNGEDRGCSLLKFQRDFVTRTFAPVLPIFHQVLRANQMVSTALK